MSVTGKTARGRVYTRKFDHDEARRLHETGESYSALGRRYGVSATAVRRVCDHEFARCLEERARAFQQSACPGCGAPTWAGRHCVDCVARARTKVHDGRAYCPACDTWKPVEDFSPSNGRRRRGVHMECRVCDTARRRRWRQENRERENATTRERRRRKAAA